MSPTHFSARLALLGGWLLAAPAMAEPKAAEPFKCPKLSTKLTTTEVFNARLEALKAGNLDLAFCYYDEKAVIVMPGTVVRGREPAKQAFAQFGAAFGGALPEPRSLTVEGEIAFVTFSLTTPTASIPDGADTFIIRKGRIQAQVVHANVVPASAPPAQAPAPAPAK